MVDQCRGVQEYNIFFYIAQNFYTKLEHLKLNFHLRLILLTVSFFQFLQLCVKIKHSVKNFNNKTAVVTQMFLQIGMLELKGAKTTYTEPSLTIKSGEFKTIVKICKHIKKSKYN